MLSCHPPSPEGMRLGRGEGQKHAGWLFPHRSACAPGVAAIQAWTVGLPPFEACDQYPGS